MCVCVSVSVSVCLCVALCVLCVSLCVSCVLCVGSLVLCAFPRFLKAMQWAAEGFFECLLQKVTSRTAGDATSA